MSELLQTAVAESIQAGDQEPRAWFECELLEGTYVPEGCERPAVQWSADGRDFLFRGVAVAERAGEPVRLRLPTAFHLQQFRSLTRLMEMEVGGERWLEVWQIEPDGLVKIRKQPA